MSATLLRQFAATPVRCYASSLLRQFAATPVRCYASSLLRCYAATLAERPIVNP